jgi:hypothetical protein
MSVEFHGLIPSSDHLHLDGRALFSEVTISSPFRRTPAEPSGELTKLKRAVRPHLAKLVPPAAPLEGCPGIGDQWPDSVQIYDYLIAYKFSLSEVKIATDCHGLPRISTDCHGLPRIATDSYLIAYYSSPSEVRFDV